MSSRVSGEAPRRSGLSTGAWLNLRFASGGLCNAAVEARCHAFLVFLSQNSIKEELTFIVPGFKNNSCEQSSKAGTIISLVYR